MLSYCLQPHIIQPTRTTDHSPALIDNIFLNLLNEYFTISGNIIYDLTDHLSKFLIIQNYTGIKMYKRDYSEFNETTFIEEWQSANWEEIVPSDFDTNRMFNLFCSKLSEIIDAHIPIK